MCLFTSLYRPAESSFSFYSNDSLACNFDLFVRRCPHPAPGLRKSKKPTGILFIIYFNKVIYVTENVTLPVSKSRTAKMPSQKCEKKKSKNRSQQVECEKAVERLKKKAESNCHCLPNVTSRLQLPRRNRDPGGSAHLCFRQCAGLQRLFCLSRDVIAGIFLHVSI